jgi:hypothetical protein
VKENAETVKAAGWNLPDANTESLVMHVHFMFSIFNFCKEKYPMIGFKVLWKA